MTFLFSPDEKYKQMKLSPAGTAAPPKGPHGFNNLLGAQSRIKLRSTGTDRDTQIIRLVPPAATLEAGGIAETGEARQTITPAHRVLIPREGLSVPARFSEDFVVDFGYANDGDISRAALLRISFKYI